MSTGALGQMPTVRQVSGDATEDPVVTRMKDPR